MRFHVEALPEIELDALDKRIINRLQDDLPITEYPYAAVAEELGITPESLLARLDALLEAGVLTRFGPLYNLERMGGAFTLAAMRVKPEDFQRVAEQVNAFPEVAHNYARDHSLNMWFVLAVTSAAEIRDILHEIERRTGYLTYNFPKKSEYFLGLTFRV